jgi:kynureninase
MEKLRTKSKLLTQYMQYLVESEINRMHRHIFYI